MVKWFYNKNVTISRKSEGHIYRGSWVDGTLETVLSMVCDVQPVNREQLFKEYGFEIDCSVRIYCDLCDIRIGDIAEYGGQQYKIVKVIRWDDYLDVIGEDYLDGE